MYNVLITISAEAHHKRVYMLFFSTIISIPIISYQTMTKFIIVGLILKLKICPTFKRLSMHLQFSCLRCLQFDLSPVVNPC